MNRNEKADLDFQQRVAIWLTACFGSDRARDPVERTHRMLEEALELAQACGCTEEDARRLTTYVFGRPSGSVRQEVGGVMVTIAALCNAVDVNMDGAADDELTRDWARIDAIRLKAEAKPDNTPLPE